MAARTSSAANPSAPDAPVATPGAENYLPPRITLRALREAARSCQGCPLYGPATQTVFGAGPAHARLMLVGEQPGDREDREGKPFVGPAGGVLVKALDAVGIDRGDLYLTNVVKHFKFVPPERGKRRLHKAPSRTEIVACRPWLAAELQAVQPEVLVTLGASAAQALLGNAFRVTRHHGEWLEFPADPKDRWPYRPPSMLATIHPSAVLRAREDRKDAMAQLIDDLSVAANRLRSVLGGTVGRRGGGRAGRAGGDVPIGRGQTVDGVCERT